MRAFVVVFAFAVVVGSGACFDALVDPGAAVACVVDGDDCPGVLLCKDTVDGPRCVDPAVAAPVIDAVDVSPAVVGRDGVVTVTVDASAAARVFVDGVEVDGDGSVFVFPVVDLADGAHVVGVVVVDDDGLVAESDAAGSFVKDGSAPVVVDAGFSKDIANGGDVFLVVVATEALGGAPVLEFAGGDPGFESLGGTGTSWTFSLDVDSVGFDGEFVLGAVTVRDDVGNTAVFDADARFVIDRVAPRINGFTATPRFSNQPGFNAGEVRLAVDDPSATVEVHVGDALVACDAVDDVLVCPFGASVVDSDESQTLLATAVAHDAAGNSSVDDNGALAVAGVVFDVDPPQVVGQIRVDTEGPSQLAVELLPLFGALHHIVVSGVVDEPVRDGPLTLPQCDRPDVSGVVEDQVFRVELIDPAVNGHCDLRFFVEDVVGNRHEITSIDFNVDVDPPAAGTGTLLRAPFGGHEGVTALRVDAEDAFRVEVRENDVVIGEATQRSPGQGPFGLGLPGGRRGALAFQVFDGAGNPGPVVPITSERFVTSMNGKIAGRATPNPNVMLARRRFTPVLDDDDDVEVGGAAAIDGAVVDIRPGPSWERVDGTSYRPSVGTLSAGFDPGSGEIVLRMFTTEHRDRDGLLRVQISDAAEGDQPGDSVAIVWDEDADVLVYVDANGEAYARHGLQFTRISDAVPSNFIVESAAWDPVRRTLVSLVNDFSGDRLLFRLNAPGRDWERIDTGGAKLQVAVQNAIVSQGGSIVFVGLGAARLVDDDWEALAAPPSSPRSSTAVTVDRDRDAVAVLDSNNDVSVLEDGGWQQVRASVVGTSLVFDTRGRGLVTVNDVGTRAVVEDARVREADTLPPLRLRDTLLYAPLSGGVVGLTELHDKLGIGSSTFIRERAQASPNPLVVFGGRLASVDDRTYNFDDNTTLTFTNTPPAGVVVRDPINDVTVGFNGAGRTMVLTKGSTTWTTLADPSTAASGPFLNVDKVLRTNFTGGLFQEFTGTGWVDIGRETNGTITYADGALGLFGFSRDAQIVDVIEPLFGDEQQRSFEIADPRGVGPDGVLEGIGGVVIDVDNQDAFLSVVDGVFAARNLRAQLGPARAGAVYAFDVSDGPASFDDVDVVVATGGGAADVFVWDGAGFTGIGSVSGSAVVVVPVPRERLDGLRRSDGTVVVAVASTTAEVPWRSELFQLDGVELSVVGPR